MVFKFVETIVYFFFKLTFSVAFHWTSNREHVLHILTKRDLSEKRLRHREF